MKIARMVMVCAVLAIPITAWAASPQGNSESTETAGSNTVDNDTYIDANQILMFVTNVANFGRDVDDIFGRDIGTWWPYCGDTFFISNDIDGAAGMSPLFQAGLCLGGIDSATGDLRLAVNKYASEFGPGPMQDGSFLPDHPSFRNYKLHLDSLADNPNLDYLEWPDDQGAPLNDQGRPDMMGRQLLWSVCNDANPDWHTNSAGETEPIGVEAHQTVWSFWDPGTDTVSYPCRVIVEQEGSTEFDVSVSVLDYNQVTGHSYAVVIDSGGVHLPVWNLVDETSGQTLLTDRPLNSKDTIDGLIVSVTGEYELFESFQVVANAGGVLDPPDAGALWWVGFPVPTERDPDGYISIDQQITDFPYNVYWGIHTEDNGGTNGGGTNSSYEAFLANVTDSGANNEAIGFYDYELRFTGSNDNPGTGGSYAVEWPESNHAFWVPFEIWRIGTGTPDDPSDDVRLVPYIFDPHAINIAWMGDDKFQLDNWGSSADGSCVLDCEHSCSAGDDDPWTDRIFWNMPTDSTLGQSGYLANEVSMLAGTFDASLVAYEILARTVLVSWNGGLGPPFAMDHPEQGTVFRILTQHTVPEDTFRFSTSQTQLFTGDYEGATVYLRYKLYNKGDRVLNDAYLGLWVDPDIGMGSDDFVGCDTLNNLGFCYNSDNEDGEYGGSPPAIGFKVLHGPLVPAPGETATFDNQPLPDHRNLDMSVFVKIAQGTLDDSLRTYNYLQGLSGGLNPYEYEGQTLTYMHSGDPVTGLGDLDYAPDDRQFIMSCGPFDFRPGDSQFVLIKMSVGRGPDNLQSITAVKALLNEDFDPYTVDTGSGRPTLPSTFWVSQNYPNPFNPRTTIDYSLSQRARVTVDIYNILGQRVRRLRDRFQPAGNHSVEWDGTDGNGKVLATGLYFYKVQAGNATVSKKMVLLK